MLRRFLEVMRMTKQYELKQRAYASDLKSRALSVLIYLIDRSNKELTCFPAIPTMARELHISVSTVKRALHELVAAGFVAKDSRFRENNHGQTSNLYTLQFSDCSPNNDSNQPIADEIENTPEPARYAAEQITFEIIAREEAAEMSAHEDTGEALTPAPICRSTVDTPVQSGVFLTNPTKMIIPACCSILEKAMPVFIWTGGGVHFDTSLNFSVLADCETRKSV